MTREEIYIYQKWCWDNGITIYPKPITYNGSRCKIVINTNGQETIGKEVYEDKPTSKLIEIKTPSGIKQEKQIIPGLYEKIAELYRDTYLKNKDKVA